MSPPISKLKCGSGSAYTKMAKTKNGFVWHHIGHFKKFRIIAKGKLQGWYEIWVMNGCRWFRNKWRPKYSKIRVPADCILYLPRQRGRAP